MSNKTVEKNEMKYTKRDLLCNRIVDAKAKVIFWRERAGSIQFMPFGVGWPIVCVCIYYFLSLFLLFFLSKSRSFRTERIVLICAIIFRYVNYSFSTSI